MRPTRPSLLDGGRNGAGPSRNDSGPRRSSRRVQKTPVYTERVGYATVRLNNTFTVSVTDLHRPG